MKSWARSFCEWGDWIFTNFRSHNWFHRGRFITTTFQMSFGKYKFKPPICAESRVASFCDFSHKREVQLGAPFLRQNALLIGAWFYTPQFLPVKFSSMDKWFLWELVHYFRFRFYVLFILFILLSTLMLKPITTWKSGCGVLKFLNR